MTVLLRPLSSDGRPWARRRMSPRWAHRLRPACATRRGGRALPLAPRNAQSHPRRRHAPPAGPPGRGCTAGIDIRTCTKAYPLYTDVRGRRRKGECHELFKTWRLSANRSPVIASARRARRQHAPDADGAADTRRRLARPRRTGRLHGSLQAGASARQAVVWA